MTRRLSLSRLRISAIAVVALVVGAGVAVVSPAEPAHAAAGVSVTVEGRDDLVAVADPTYLTQLRLNGSGFQSIQNGFGGIYVMFGWVSGDGWQPTQGGVTGENYRYVPDDETNPTGYIDFVTFPGSSTAYAANGGEIAADGTWSALLSVPGAKFTALDRDGNATEVDCTQVQCGIITMGAHGVKNGNNETFTPITFQNLYESGETVADPAAEAEVQGTPTPTPTASAAAVEPAPAQTTYIVEQAAPAATDADASQDTLVSALMWGAIGVGALAVAAIAFLVWAVLSSRRRVTKASGGDAS